MTTSQPAFALPLPAGDGASPPDWVHLLPAGEITTFDGRGPYRVPDPEGLIAASLQDGHRLPLDENHATDLAGPKGQPSPARGWIVELQARADGVWGRVEWTAAGRQLVQDRAYRHLSPVIVHGKDGTVTKLLRASLINTPNLRGLAALHAEAGAEVGPGFLDAVRTLLALPAEADENAILAQVRTEADQQAQDSDARKAFLAELRTLLNLQDDPDERMMERLILAQLRADVRDRAKLAEATGLQASADGAAVLQAVQALRDPAKVASVEIVTALQAELVGLKREVAEERAVSFVEGAIKAGKLIAPQKVRDHYIARHMADPTAVELEIGAMLPFGGPSGATGAAPKFGAGTDPQLDPDEARIVKMMALDPKLYQETKAKQAAQEEGP